MTNEKQIQYAENYKIENGCLYEIKYTKQGAYDKSFATSNRGS